MKEFGKIIRELREKKGYPLRKVAAFLDIDQAILSKVERGQRKISKEQVVKLAEFFHYDEKKLLIAYLSDRIVYEVKNEDYASEAIKAAEEKIGYLVNTQTDKSKIIRKINNVLRKFKKIKKAWIYGSFARGEDGVYSDIDIAVRADQGLSYFDLAEIQYKLENAVKRKIDIGFIDSFKEYVYEKVKPELTLIYERR